VIAKSRSEFHAAPLGAFTYGATWMYFALEEGPHGYALWGAPTEEDMAGLIAVLEGELVREPPHPGLVDLRDLEGVQPTTFVALERYTTRNAARLSRIVTSTAMVRPGGLVGLMAEGFFRVVPAPFPVRFFTEVVPALAESGHPRPEGAAAELSAARAEAAAVSPFRLALARYLSEQIASATIEGAARAAGASVRTLQRRLESESTTFARELADARVKRARVLLEQTDASATAIAFDLGFATPQHFSEVFKRATGEAPTAYRAARRRSD